MRSSCFNLGESLSRHNIVKRSHAITKTKSYKLHNNNKAVELKGEKATKVVETPITPRNVDYSAWYLC